MTIKRRDPAGLKLWLVELYLNGEGRLKSIAKAHDIIRRRIWSTG